MQFLYMIVIIKVMIQFSSIIVANLQEYFIAGWSKEKIAQGLVLVKMDFRSSKNLIILTDISEYWPVDEDEGSPFQYGANRDQPEVQPWRRENRALCPAGSDIDPETEDEACDRIPLPQQ